MDNFPSNGFPFWSNDQQLYPPGFFPHPQAMEMQQERSRGPNNPARRSNHRKRFAALNREHTVTTLTDSNAIQGPSATGQPAGDTYRALPYAAENMSSSAMMNPHGGYDMPGAYGYGFEIPFGLMQHQQMNHQPPQQMQGPPQQRPPQTFAEGAQRQQPGAPTQSLPQSRRSSDATSSPNGKPALPDGKDDLEILQNLKKLILENQHPFYKAIPKPEYLAQLYKGQIPTGTSAKEFIANGGTSAPEPPLKVEPASARIEGVSAQPGGLQSLGGSEHSSVPEQAKFSVSQTSQASSERQISPSRLQGLGVTGNDALPKTPEGPAVQTPSSQKKTPSPPAFSTPQSFNSQPSTHRASPTVTDVKPVVHPVQVTEPPKDSMHVDQVSQPAASGVPTGKGPSIPFPFKRKPATPQPATAPLSASQSVTDVKPIVRSSPVAQASPDSMQVDQKPQPAISGVPKIEKASNPPFPFKLKNTGPSHLTPAPAVSNTPVKQEGQAGSDARDAVKSEPLSWGTPLSAPTGKPVPFSSQRLSDRLGPSTNALAADIVPFGGASTNIPGLGPMISSSGFTPVLAPSQPNHLTTTKPSPAADTRAVAAKMAPPSSAPAAQSFSVPAFSSPAPAAGHGTPVADQAHRPTLKERLEQPPAPQLSRPAVHSDSHPQGAQDRNTNNNHNNNQKGRNNKKNANPPYTGPPKGNERSYDRPPGASHGPPPPASVSASAPLRAPFRGRSPTLEPRKPANSPGSRPPPPRDFHGPSGRSPSRERASYSRPPPPPSSHVLVEARRDSIDIDRPPPGRYDGRSSYPEYSPGPPPLSGGRGPPPDMPPPSGGRGDYYGSFSPAQDRNARWEDPYYKRDWERGPMPASPDRRFERDYPPAPGSWDRSDRDFGDRESLYAEEYTPREPERARPPATFTPAPGYSRVRGRSPSPLGRAGPGDASRPPIKRAREDFGSEYYPGPGGGGAAAAGRPPVRRGDYTSPPPRSGGADWAGPGGAPPLSGSSAPGGRDYPGRGDSSMEYSPLPGNYDRARSPPPASGGRDAYFGPGPGGRPATYNRAPERYGSMRPPP